jgi:hypothetical protein
MKEQSDIPDILRPELRQIAVFSKLEKINSPEIKKLLDSKTLINLCGKVEPALQYIEGRCEKDQDNWNLYGIKFAIATLNEKFKNLEFAPEIKSDYFQYTASLQIDQLPPLSPSGTKLKDQTAILATIKQQFSEIKILSGKACTDDFPEIAELLESKTLQNIIKKLEPAMGLCLTICERHKRDCNHPSLFLLDKFSQKNIPAVNNLIEALRELKSTLQKLKITSRHRYSVFQQIDELKLIPHVDLVKMIVDYQFS